MQSPDPQPPAWTVEQEDGRHVLYYLGKEQSSTRLSAGPLVEMAALFNRNGTIPKKTKAIRCAADSPDPDKYISSHSHKSASLPLEDAPRPFLPGDFPQLLCYMKSLFDDSPINSVPKPPFYADAESQIDIISEHTFDLLRWLGELPPEQLHILAAIPSKDLPSKLPAVYGDKQTLKDFPRTLAFVLKHHPHITPSKPQTKTPPIMSKKQNTPTGLAVESIAPLAELIPASQFSRYPTNRHPNAEAVANMAASVREHGIIQPILARHISNPETGGTDLQIVYGETRWRGCQAVDPNYLVPCYIRPLDDREAAKIHAIENFQRKDLTEIEEAREIRHLKDVGWTLDEIEGHLGRSKEWLYRRLGLLNLPPEGQQAVIDGNLSIHTATRIVSLPEEYRLEAVKAVIEPRHAARALPEREAIALIQKEFIEPLKKEEEWNEKRQLLEDENPGCVWLEYKHAVKADSHHSDYERAAEEPTWNHLSDSARANELTVPTWETLARKHGAPIYIGLLYNGDAALFVAPDSIIEAEKSAHDDKPGDCIFTHEKAVRENRLASEKRKMEDAHQREAIKAERHRFAQTLLDPSSYNKTATRKLAEKACQLFFDYSILEDIHQVLDVPEVTPDGNPIEWDLVKEKRDVLIGKALKAKEANPFEVLGRLIFAELTEKVGDTKDLLATIFSAASAKPADYPELHKLHLLSLAKTPADQEEEDAA